MISLPRERTLENIGKPSAPLLTVFLPNLNLRDVSFFANRNDSNEHRIQITTRDAFQNLRAAGYISYISDSPEPEITSTPYAFRGGGASDLEVYFHTTKLSVSYLSRPPSKPKQPHRPNDMSHPRNPFSFLRNALAAPGMSYAGGRSELELAMGEGLRVFFELRP